MKKTLMSLAMTAVLGFASASASAEFLDFQVNEGVVAGTTPNIFTADKLNGAYTEFLTPGPGGTFTAAAVGSITSFLSDEGTQALTTQLGTFGAAGYSIYAIFTATGNITGPNTFVGTGGGFSLYLDPDANTKFLGFNASNDGLTTPTADAGTDTLDVLLASTFTTVSGSGNLNGPPGAFDITFKDFILTDFGKQYFFDPDPFHMIVRINGDYDGVSSVGDPALGIKKITGDVSAVFQVPEPGSLALLGLGLAGLGMFQRRRKLSK